MSFGWAVAAIAVAGLVLLARDRWRGCTGDHHYGETVDKWYKCYRAMGDKYDVYRYVERECQHSGCSAKRTDLEPTEPIGAVTEDTLESGLDEADDGAFDDGGRV